MKWLCPACGESLAVEGEICADCEWMLIPVPPASAADLELDRRARRRPFWNGDPQTAPDLPDEDEDGEDDLGHYGEDDSTAGTPDHNRRA